MRLILSLISIFILPGVVFATLRGIAILFRTSNILIFLSIGFVVGLILYKYVFSRINVFTTFEHELTHAVVALLFFRKITRFVVTKSQGGYIQHSGEFGGEIGDHIIGLAPYFLPTFTIISVFVRPLISSEWFPWFDIWIGLSFAYHMFSTLEELRENWTKQRFQSTRGDSVLSDIGRRGFIFSGIIIVTLTLATHALICFIIAEGYHGILIWSNVTWGTSVKVYTNIINCFSVYST